MIIQFMLGSSSGSLGCTPWKKLDILPASPSRSIYSSCLLVYFRQMQTYTLLYIVNIEFHVSHLICVN